MKPVKVTKQDRLSQECWKPISNKPARKQSARLPSKKKARNWTNKQITRVPASKEAWLQTTNAQESKQTGRQGSKLANDQNEGS